MNTLISVGLWIVFAGIPTLIVLIPIFFILKSKNMHNLWYYLTASLIVGFLVKYALELTPYFLSGIVSLKIEDLVIVSDGNITLDGYLYFVSNSLLAALITAAIGFLWWYFLVRKATLNDNKG